MKYKIYSKQDVDKEEIYYFKLVGTIVDEIILCICDKKGRELPDGRILTITRGKSLLLHSGIDPKYGLQLNKLSQIQLTGKP